MYTNNTATYTPTSDAIRFNAVVKAATEDNLSLPY